VNGEVKCGGVVDILLKSHLDASSLNMKAKMMMRRIMMEMINYFYNMLKKLDVHVVKKMDIV
jgi:hypothetical protein